MNSINLPKIKDISKLNIKELDLLLEKDGVKVSINNVNWEKEFPYMPDCTAKLAYTDKHIVILFNVRGLDLRAEELEDNGKMWEDSCCELFILDNITKEYYNFEINGIGKLLNCKGLDRHNRIKNTPENLNKVLRYSSLLTKKYNLNDHIFEWQVGMAIPFELIGIDPKNMPEKIKGNIYKCGDKTAHPHFVSWNKIETENPDFHRPEFFGEFLFK